MQPDAQPGPSQPSKRVILGFERISGLSVSGSGRRLLSEFGDHTRRQFLQTTLGDGNYNFVPVGSHNGIAIIDLPGNTSALEILQQMADFPGRPNVYK